MRKSFLFFLIFLTAACGGIIYLALNYIDPATLDFFGLSVVYLSVFFGFAGLLSLFWLIFSKSPPEHIFRKSLFLSAIPTIFFILQQFRILTFLNGALVVVLILILESIWRKK